MKGKEKLMRRGHSCFLFITSVSDERPGVKSALNYTVLASSSVFNRSCLLLFS